MGDLRREPDAGLPGVNVCGYLRTESGVGAAARGYARALRGLGVPLAFTDVSGLSINRAEDRSLDLEPAGAPHGLNLVCVDVDRHYSVLSHAGPEFFEGRYNIGVWWWEQSRFPDKWRDLFGYYDEVWVGTSFIANAIAPVSPLPVVRIPPVVTPPAGSAERGRRRLGAAPNEFVFLFVFDANSTFARKNPLAVVDAFRTAFTADEPARLVLKCANARHNPAGLAELTERARGRSISIHPDYWSSEEMADLMAAGDCYVSLHRSEGAGLTIAEAMALGKPVIATGWSGNMDFMTFANSFPVRYDLVELAENSGPYRAGLPWAEPSATHAAELMRYVYEHRDEAAARGRAARRDVAAGHSVAAVAAAVRDRLGAIALRRRLPEFRNEVKAAFRAYCEMRDRIRAVVRDVLPADATVAVVSKGDDRLLDLGVRQAWHFPRREDGTYVGHHPADSSAALAHLRELQAKGARYLLFPTPARWWLEHYGEFARYLADHATPIHADEHSCAIYALQSTADACQKMNGTP